MDSAITQIVQNDGYQTRLYYYKTTKDTVSGAILILHGMAEHHGRYLDFIQSLTREGFDVYAYDHRGHGTDKKLSELGFIAKKHGANRLVSDAHTVCQYIRANSRSDKLAVFGHSMGSLTLRCLLQTYDDIDCAIVSSTTMPPKLVSLSGRCIASLCCFFGGAKKQSPFLQKLMFGGKEYTSLCTRTTYDWLTRNNTLVGQYINDPYCGFTGTASFYRDLVTLCLYSSRKKAVAKTRKNLPLLLLTGSKDPVGGYTSQIIRLHKLYSALGFEQAELIIYQDARHELLNETNSDEVYADIFAYLHKHLQ